MAKKSVIQRNLVREKLISKYSERRKILKDAIKDPSSNFYEKLRLSRKLDSLPVDGSPVRYRRRCSITGRARGKFDKRFGISRIVFRDLVAKGQIPGVSKGN